MKYSKAVQAEAVERLRENIERGDTIYNITRSTAKSGLSGVYQFFTVKEWGGKYQPAFLGYNAAIACGFQWDDKNNGVRVCGCGLNRPFEVVYALGRLLFDDAYALDSRDL